MSSYIISLILSCKQKIDRSKIMMPFCSSIACPCALALATPMASLIGISLLAKKSLLFKEAKFLEVIAKADTIVIDKTGTLTKGVLSVTNYEIYNRDKIYMDLLYSLLNSSNHPISKAVKNKLNKLNVRQF